MKKLANAATEGPWEWEEVFKVCLGRLPSQSTGACVAACVADLQGNTPLSGTCTTPSVADARFMEEASPASILRLIARLKRAQVTSLCTLAWFIYNFKITCSV
jgi:hypothetical protein